ncbi:hypothetical protein BJV78DRAFT_1156908 [Lactifluus subvellereus]|nr:hypothetical protein BJV78DRAFT_1156908 [Lactifluus subvellereus]
MSMSDMDFWPSITRSQHPESNDGLRRWNQRHRTSLEESVINVVFDATDPVAVLTKRHRNSICAVTRILPPELLSYIFSINVLCDPPRPNNGGYNLGWISVTHVCYQWREVGHPARVALATSSLWGYLDFTRVRETGVLGSFGGSQIGSTLASQERRRADSSFPTMLGSAAGIPGATTNVKGVYDNQLPYVLSAES